MRWLHLLWIIPSALAIAWYWRIVWVVLHMED